MEATECETGLNLFEQSNDTERFFESLSHFRDSYRAYHATICLVICTLGVLTNVLNILVLTKRQMRTSVNIILTAIAICDTGTMLSYLIYIIHFVMNSDRCDPSIYSYGWMFWLLCHMMVSIALHTSSLWLAVAMAFIRSMTLKEAQLASPWLKRDNAWKVSIFVYSAVFVMCIPSIFSQGIENFTADANHSCPENVAQGFVYYTIRIPECTLYRANLWLNGIVFKTIPCLLLAYFSVSLFCTIQRVHRQRRALMSTQARNRKNETANKKFKSDRTTMMLVLILIIFLLTELPQGVVAVLSGVYLRDVQRFYEHVGDILDLLSLLNSSVNFFLYCTMSAKFRQVFWQVVLPKRYYIQWYIRGKSTTTSGGVPSMTNGAQRADGMDTEIVHLKKFFRQNTTLLECEETLLTEGSPFSKASRTERICASDLALSNKVSPIWERLFTCCNYNK